VLRETMSRVLCGLVCPSQNTNGLLPLTLALNHVQSKNLLFGGGSSLHSGIEFGRSRTGEGSSGGRKKGVV
jgi:hypothetical protein